MARRNLPRPIQFCDRCDGRQGGAARGHCGDVIGEAGLRIRPTRLADAGLRIAVSVRSGATNWAELTPFETIAADIRTIGRTGDLKAAELRAWDLGSRWDKAAAVRVPEAFPATGTHPRLEANGRR